MLVFADGRDDPQLLEAAERRFPAGFDAFRNSFSDPLFSVIEVDGLSVTVGLERSDGEGEKIETARLRVVAGLDVAGAADGRRAWNGAIRLAGMLGLIDAFDIGCPDSPPPPTRSHPGSGADMTGGAAAEWREAFVLVRYSEHATVLAGIMEALRGAGVSPPEAGVDLVVADVVVCEAELAWLSLRVAVTASPIAAEGWAVMTVAEAAADSGRLLRLLGRD